MTWGGKPVMEAVWYAMREGDCELPRAESVARRGGRPRWNVDNGRSVSTKLSQWSSFDMNLECNRTPYELILAMK